MPFVICQHEMKQNHVQNNLKKLWYKAGKDDDNTKSAIGKYWYYTICWYTGTSLQISLGDFGYKTAITTLKT